MATNWKGIDWDAVRAETAKIAEENTRRAAKGKRAAENRKQMPQEKLEL